MAKKSLQEQRIMVMRLPAHHKMEVGRICHQMEGKGVKEIAKKVQGYLTPVVKEISPIIVRELIVPYIIKEGKEYLGLNGKGLSLAGQGKRPVKKPAAKKQKKAVKKVAKK